MDKPVFECKDMTVTSKKIQIAVYSDRIERSSKNAWPSKKSTTNSIPLSTISAVSSTGNGVAFKRVTFASSGGTIEVKLKNKDAEQLVATVRPMIG